VRGARASACLILCAVLAGPLAAQAPQRFDPGHTRFSFEVRTRWGQRVTGTFPQYAGEVRAAPDGRHVVRIRLATGAVVVAGSPRNTALARGAGFFDAPRHPSIEFVSDPYPEPLLRTGGALRGRLTIHGITDPSRAAERVPTVSVSMNGVTPRAAAQALGREGIFVWDGDFYATGLIERLGKAEAGGVLRLGLVHYNTAVEVDRTLEALDALGRQALHAYLLTFEHPSGGRILEFRSELPSNIARLRQNLGAQAPPDDRRK